MEDKKYFQTKILIIDKGSESEALESIGIEVKGERKWVDFVLDLRSVIAYRVYEEENKNICVYMDGDSFILPHSLEEFNDIMRTELNPHITPFTGTFSWTNPVIE